MNIAGGCLKDISQERNGSATSESAESTTSSPLTLSVEDFLAKTFLMPGQRIGIDGNRSGLWREMRRVICELRPHFVVVENVSALLQRGIERVLGDLAESGYDAEWDCIPACAVGAPHQRDRIWILAYPVQCNGSAKYGEQQSKRSAVANSSRERDVADSMRELAKRGGIGWSSGLDWWEREPEEALQDARKRRRQENGLPIDQSELGRLADGIPNRVERLTSLGNAIVPQIAQWIAERIKAVSMEHE